VGSRVLVHSQSGIVAGSSAAIPAIKVAAIFCKESLWIVEQRRDPLLDEGDVVVLRLGADGKGDELVGRGGCRTGCSFGCADVGERGASGVVRT
jgi:hypothetical protein